MTYETKNPVQDFRRNMLSYKDCLPGGWKYSCNPFDPALQNTCFTQFITRLPLDKYPFSGKFITCSLDSAS